MTEPTRQPLTLYGVHVPDVSDAPIQGAANDSGTLPGLYRIYVDVEGVPVLLFEKKAGKLLQQIETARQNAPTPAASAPADPQPQV
jgi:hypothetical protein